MRKLTRFFGAALLATAAAGCGESPTVPGAKPTFARHTVGGSTGGGGVEADTVTTNTISSDGDGRLLGCTTTERGGHMMGGGYLVEPVTCSP